jgi:hypothetical protein
MIILKVQLLHISECSLKRELICVDGFEIRSRSSNRTTVAAYILKQLKVTRSHFYIALYSDTFTVGDQHRFKKWHVDYR